MEDISLTHQIIGSFIAIVVIFGSTVWLLNKTKNEQHKDQLVSVVIYGLNLLIGIYVIDKIVAIRIEILSEQESISLFNFIQDIVLMVFGYYFGSKTAKLNNGDDNIKK